MTMTAEKIQTKVRLLRALIDHPRTGQVRPSKEIDMFTISFTWWVHGTPSTSFHGSFTTVEAANDAMNAILDGDSFEGQSFHGQYRLYVLPLPDGVAPKPLP